MWNFFFVIKIRGAPDTEFWSPAGIDVRCIPNINCKNNKLLHLGGCLHRELEKVNETSILCQAGLMIAIAITRKIAFKIMGFESLVFNEFYNADLFIFALILKKML